MNISILKASRKKAKTSKLNFVSLQSYILSLDLQQVPDDNDKNFSGQVFLVTQTFFDDHLVILQLIY